MEINKKDKKGLKQGVWEDAGFCEITGIDYLYKTYYVNDKLHGLWKTWGKKSKNLLYEVYFEDGETEGEQIGYSFNGLFIDGNLEGETILKE
jgi:antitoxin component YwqK of YwqJK toxin-antitoxin module